MRAFHEVRTYPEDFKVWASSYENISFLSHWHNEIELIYVRQGQAEICVTDHSFVAHEGDLIICDNGDIHYSNSQEMKNILEFVIFDSAIITNMYESPCFKLPIVKKDELKRLGLFEKVDKLFANVSAELEKRDRYYKDVVKAQIREVWYLLKRELPRDNANKPSLNRRMEQLNDFQRLLSYMEKNYAEDISLSAAAEMIGFSDSHFSKTFKKINFVSYLNMLRVEHAAEQLKNTSYKVTDIALQCGFDNVRTFNRVFKEVTGSTPSAFAKGTDTEAYDLAMYSRKASRQQFVKEESKTVIRNIKE